MRCTYKSLILIAACVGALSACGGNDSSLASVTAQSKQLLRSDKAAASDYQTVLQELYISSFGRPADPAGLVYWEGVLLAGNAPTTIEGFNAAYSTNAVVNGVVNSFGNSAESVALYGSGNASVFVTAIYQDVLGRAPDQGGLDYWAGLINKGAMTQGQAALAIMAAAASEPTTSIDEQIVNNRLIVANYFTAQVSSQNAAIIYSGNASNVTVRAMLNAVTATTDTTAYETAVNTTITALIAANNNVQPIVVDSGPAPGTFLTINEVFTSVTICAPANPTLCQTIDHVLVDTGSVGLRLISSVLTPAMASALSAQTATGSHTLVECTMFADGYAWGPVRSANFQIAGESAQGMLMQVIGDQNFSSVPTTCSNLARVNENTVAKFGANGVIGVGLFQQDCGNYCAQTSATGYYYTCSSTSCTETTASLAQQVPNPVSLFAADNNGVIISLPAVASGGAVSVNGTMTFGVGTRANNGLGSAAMYQMNSIGEFSTTFNGAKLTESFIDSGSNGLFFPSNSIATCTDGWYCPATQLNLSATMIGTNNVSGTVNFSIGNFDNATNNFLSYAVYIPAGGTNSNSNSFDWGLPFFFGRNVFVVTENKTAGSGTGPFVAF